MDEVKSRPFHETIVSEILEQSEVACGTLGPVLLRSDLPANHDNILSAVEKKWGHQRYYVMLLGQIRTHILAEKARAKAKAALKKKAEEEKAVAEAEKDRLLDETEKILDNMVQCCKAGVIVGPREEAHNIGRLLFNVKTLREKSGRKLPSS